MIELLKKWLPAALYLTVGSVAAAFALEEFLVPSTILDGGVVGVSMIASQLSHIRLGLLTFILNIPFLIIGARNLGKRFFLSAIYAMALFSVMLRVFEDLANATRSEAHV